MVKKASLIALGNVVNPSFGIMRNASGMELRAALSRNCEHAVQLFQSITGHYQHYIIQALPEIQGDALLAE
jgi:hypothetical protein